MIIFFMKRITPCLVDEHVCLFLHATTNSTRGIESGRVYKVSSGINVEQEVLWLKSKHAAKGNYGNFVDQHQLPQNTCQRANEGNLSAKRRPLQYHNERVSIKTNYCLDEYDWWIILWFKQEILFVRLMH